MDIRYLLDENVNPVLRVELLKRAAGMIIWKVGDPGAPSRGTADPDILLWCEKNSFILVTNNRKSMPKHLKNHLANNHQIPGILVLNPEMSIGDTIEELLLIWELSDALEYRNLILYLPVT